MFTGESIRMRVRRSVFAAAAAFVVLSTASPETASSASVDGAFSAAVARDTE